MNVPISDLLPNVEADTDPGDIVLDAMILLRVINTEGDGQPRIVLATTPDLDWMLQIGMLDVARHICINDIGPAEEDE